MLKIPDMFLVLNRKFSARAGLYFSLIIFSLTLFGCMAAEKVDTRVLVGEDATQVITTYYNISSDKEDIEEGFKELLDYWQSDSTLVDSAKDHRCIKSREVYLDKGVLTGRIVEVTSSLEYVDELDKTEGEWEHTVDRDDKGPLETNGKITDSVDDKDEVKITWPLGTKEFYWKTAGTEFGELAKKNSIPMREKFQSYQRTQWRKKLKSLLVKFKHPRALFRTLKTNLM